MDPLTLLQTIDSTELTRDELATRLGLDNARLTQGLDILRSEGLTIETDPRVRLGNSAGFGSTVLAWRLGRPVSYHPRCDSTNRIARRLARDWHSGPGPLVVADFQTAGRGRLSRVWSSDASQNLLFSLCLALELPGDRAGRAPLAWGAAMAEALDVEVKWPNDLVDGKGRKLGGMLIELLDPPVPGKPLRMVLGVGININQLHFEDLPMATSLRQLRGREVDRASILAQLVGAIEAARPAAPSALEHWRARSNTLGRRVRIGRIEGVAQDIREDGALLVDGQPVLAGDVSLIG